MVPASSAGRAGRGPPRVPCHPAMLMSRSIVSVQRVLGVLEFRGKERF